MYVSYFYLFLSLSFFLVFFFDIDLSSQNLALVGDRLPLESPASGFKLHLHWLLLSF